MTEGNGHVIDPAGAARRALQAAVAEHGPLVLSDPGSMDRIGRESLAGLPGEAILIGSAARTDVPALLRERIPRLGNYGAIQSVAATLAEAHSLEPAACVWVVREFARALGLIAPGGTQTAAASGRPQAAATGATALARKGVARAGQPERELRRGVRGAGRKHRARRRARRRRARRRRARRRRARRRRGQEGLAVTPSASPRRSR